MANSNALRRCVAGLILGAGYLAARVLMGCVSTVPPPSERSSPGTPRAQMLCEDVIAMPCLSGRTCMEEEGKGCVVCKCLGPEIVPLDHPWMATEDPLLTRPTQGGPEPR